VSTNWNVDLLAGEAIAEDVVLRPTPLAVVDAPSVRSGDVWLVDPNLAVFPTPSDVLLGVDYGRTGIEYEGTHAPGGGSNTYSRGRVVNA